MNSKIFPYLVAQNSYLNTELLEFCKKLSTRTTNSVHDLNIVTTKPVSGHLCLWTVYN